MRIRWSPEETYSEKKNPIIHILETIGTNQHYPPYNYRNINTNLFHVYERSVHINSLISLVCFFSMFL